MSLMLSMADREQFPILRNANVLQKLDLRKTKRRTAGVVCGDGNQSSDLLCKHFQINELSNGNHQTLSHFHALNGGALLLAPHSPFVTELRQDLVLMAELAEDPEVKENIEEIILYSHAPCGKAYKKHLGLMQVIALHMEAQRRVQERFPTAQVSSYLHIDFGNGRKHTYYMSLKEWDTWRADPANAHWDKRIADFLESLVPKVRKHFCTESAYGC